MQAKTQGGEDSTKPREAVHQAYRNSSALEAALNASTLPTKEALPFTSQLQEETPADSNLSDATQGPNWLQRWAALLMPSDSNDQSQASLQQFMTNITVAMQQAQREGMQLPQAQEVLASLMSLASVQSPALAGPAEMSNKGMHHAWRDAHQSALKHSDSLTQAPSTAGTARPASEKRHQPLPAEGEPHKIARISQSNPRSETLSIHPATSSHASWYRAPILIQQRSNPEPGEIAHLPIKTAAQPMETPRSGSKSHFRVYSNAFQEPVPAPRWGSSKTARGKARQDARSSSGSDSRFRPQVIVTGASGTQKMREVEPSDRDHSRGRPQWGVASPMQRAPTSPIGTPQLQNDSSAAGLTCSKAGAEPFGHSGHSGIPQDSRNGQAVDRIGSDRGSAHTPPHPVPIVRTEQSLPHGLEGQMAAAAWLRQRGVGHPLMTAEPGMNPFATGDMSVFANALAKLPMQAQQQAGPPPAGMPPHISQLMHLQQLAQTLGSSTAAPPWQLPLSQSQPPANHLSQQQWKEAMLMQAAKAGNPAGPAKVYYQQTWPADKDSIVRRGMYASATTANRSNIKQPVPRRPLPESQCHSPSHHSPGEAIDARTHLEHMIFLEPGQGRRIGNSRPVADLPSERSWSTPVTRLHELGPELPRAPSTDSSLSGPHAIDINNPFEVHREQLALEASPPKDTTKGLLTPPLVRQMGGNGVSRIPAFQRVVPPSVVVKQQQQGSQSPSARRWEGRYSSSPSSDRNSSRTEDEEMAAQTLLSLVVPMGQDRASLPTEGSVMRRPRSHRPRGRR